MKEIQTMLTSIFDKAILIHNLDVPQQTKDNAKQIFIDSLDLVYASFSPQTINNLVMEQYRKNLIKKDAPYG